MMETFRPIVLLISCIASVFWLSSANENASMLITVNPERQQLVDTYGREVFFHGTNVVIKQFPYHPETSGYGPHSFWEADMKLLQSLGLNVVRLGMMLPGYVPERKKYNETYLQVIQKIVSKAAEYGIYTLLDMHQDVMSRKFCVEGFPDWAANPGNAQNFPWPFDDKWPIDPETGYPYDEDCAKHTWSDYYFTEAASAAFQILYNNTDGLLDDWADFWKRTAQGFEKYDSVIGYELINEPWAGDIYRNPKLMIPGFADKLNLEPAYDTLQKAIRTVDQRHAIFFEGVTWDFFAVGFSKVPGGDSYQNRSVLSYHYYEPPDFNKKFDFEVRMEDLARLRCAGFVTELLTVGSTSKDWSDMTKLFDLTDQHQQSWMGWSYKPYGCSKTLRGCKTKSLHSEDGELDVILVQNTSRTYPQAVAGYTKRFSFNPTTKQFQLVYEVSPKCQSKQTIVYFNKELHYSKGYSVSVSPEGAAEWHEVGTKITIEHSASPGTIITFSLQQNK